MDTKMDPHIRLDRRQVPCHWHAVPSQEGFSFRHRKRGVTVEAVEVDDVDPDFTERWRLQYRERCNEAESCRSVARVTNETEALDALFSWMEWINNASQDGLVPDIAALGTAAAREMTQTGARRTEPQAVRSGNGWRDAGPGPERDAHRGRPRTMTQE